MNLFIYKFFCFLFLGCGWTNALCFANGVQFLISQPSHGASYETQGLEVAYKERGSRYVSEATGNDRFYLTELSPSTSSLAFPAGFFLGYNVTGQDFRGGWI